MTTFCLEIVWLVYNIQWNIATKNKEDQDFTKLMINNDKSSLVEDKFMGQVLIKYLKREVEEVENIMIRKFLSSF